MPSDAHYKPILLSFMTITMERTLLLTLLLITRKSKPNRTLLPSGYTKLSVCILALLLYSAVEIISVVFESTLDLGKDINKHMINTSMLYFRKEAFSPTLFHFLFLIRAPGESQGKCSNRI